MRLEILESKNTVALTNYKGVWPGGIIVARVKVPAVPLSNNYFLHAYPSRSCIIWYRGRDGDA